MPDAPRFRWHRYDAHANALLQTLELEGDEAALCATLVTFEKHPTEVLLVVGVAKALKFGPRSCEGGALRVYARRRVPPRQIVAPPRL